MLTISRLFRKATPVKPVSERSTYDAIDDYLAEQMRRFNLPGASIAIVEGNRIVHLSNFGRAGPGGQAPTPQTPFFIGSLTKSFTALAVMQLAEAGKIQLDAPVQRYLPWFRVADPQASAQITIRHLLNQTSGFSQPAGMVQLANFDDRPGAAQQQASMLAAYKLTRPVGSAFEYSNVNYNLLGLAIEAVSNEAYDAYIQRHIFNPLGMSHSHTSKTAARWDRLAVGHLSCFGIPVAVPDLPVPRGSLPSGQLISSAEDLAHYLIAHLNQGRYNDIQILSPESIDELHRPAAEIKAMGADLGDYGMGWFIDETNQGRRIWHSGTCPDFFSYMALLPEQKRGLVLLVNANQMLLNFALSEVGAGAAALLACAQPRPNPLGFVLWAVRGFLLIPFIQIAGVSATVQMVRRWRQDPGSRPSQGRLWGQHILLPLIPNLSLAAVPVLMRSAGMLKFLLLFMPDLSALALISGSFAGLWALLRTRLIRSVIRR